MEHTVLKKYSGLIGDEFECQTKNSEFFIARSRLK